jgi:hypothetical protein
LIRVPQVDGFADAVVGRALQRNLGRQNPAQGICQRGTSGINDGRMVEPGCARRWRRTSETFPGVQRDVMVLSASRPADRAVPVSLRQFKTKQARVKAKRALEVRNF